MLHAHPRIAIPPENRLVLPADFDRERFGDLTREQSRRLLAEHIVGATWFDDLGLNREATVERIVALGWTVGAAVGTVLRAYADRFGKIRWGDKRPYYRNSIWAIRRMFPSAQFVHLLRDGRDCVASMRTVPPWDTGDLYARIWPWVEAVDYGRRGRLRLGPDTYYELTYEQLVADPEKQLAALCDFLGERFDDAMLSPDRHADRVIPGYQTWHVRTRQEISAASVGPSSSGWSRGSCKCARRLWATGCVSSGTT